MKTSRLCSKNKDEWNKLVIENNGLFLQSWEWGEFQESLDRKIWRIGDCENWAVLVIKYNLPMGKNYLYCPGGPVLKSQYLTSALPALSEESPFSAVSKERELNMVKDFLGEIQKIAQKEKSIFLRIEPLWPVRRVRGEEFTEVGLPDGSPTSVNWENMGFKKSDGGQNILQTLVLDLNKLEEELLAEMKQKTRYNIRLAEKHGIKIRISNEPEKEIEYFWQLAKETSQRDGFHLHPREHYEKLFSVCYSRARLPSRQEGGNPGFSQVKLFLAEYRNKIIAANIVVFFGNRTIYLHGASSNEHRNLMAPYLLQWGQIKEAKKQGREIYDFWGINEIKWSGVTRFKKGFGGEEIKHIGAYDYVFDRMWYRIYKFVKRIF